MGAKKRPRVGEKLTPEQRSYVMSKIPQTATRPELKLRKLLTNIGWGCESLAEYNCRELPGSPDIVLEACQAVLFVNGCFWHRHHADIETCREAGCKKCTHPSTNVEFWERKFARNTQRDAENVSELTALGWKVHVFWECELLNEVTATERLQRILPKAPKLPPSRPEIAETWEGSETIGEAPRSEKQNVSVPDRSPFFLSTPSKRRTDLLIPSMSAKRQRKQEQTKHEVAGDTQPSKVKRRPRLELFAVQKGNGEQKAKHIHTASFASFQNTEGVGVVAIKTGGEEKPKACKQRRGKGVTTDVFRRSARLAANSSPTEQPPGKSLASSVIDEPGRNLEQGVRHTASCGIMHDGVDCGSEVQGSSSEQRPHTHADVQNLGASSRGVKTELECEKGPALTDTDGENFGRFAREKDGMEDVSVSKVSPYFGSTRGKRIKASFPCRRPSTSKAGT